MPVENTQKYVGNCARQGITDNKKPEKPCGFPGYVRYVSGSNYLAEAEARVLRTRLLGVEEASSS